MKYKVFFFVFGIVLTLLFPLCLFYVQDEVDLRQGKQNNNENFNEILSAHPIISSIYADAYAIADTELSTDYDISLMDTYEEEKQTRIKESKALFEKQIQALIDASVLPARYFSEHEQNVQITYGQLHHIQKDNSLTMGLDQVASIQQNNVVMQEFTYLKPADKITQIFISNVYIADLTDKDIKQITTNMIHYLGLSDIDDWNYLNNRYESYQAKLQVFCRVNRFEDGYANMQIGVLPISLSMDTAVR